jgi:hypothetical protein
MKNIISILVLVMAVIGISGCASPFDNTPPSSHPEAQNVTILSSSGSFSDNKTYWINGTLQNNNPFEVASIAYNITGYDKDGNIVSTDWDYADSIDLAPGSKSNFMYYLDDPNHRIVSYKVRVIDAKRSD